MVTAEEDYQSLPPTLLVFSGPGRACVEVAIVADPVLENDEAFSVTLDSMEDQGVFIVGTALAVVTILNDDGTTTHNGTYLCCLQDL